MRCCTEELESVLVIEWLFGEDSGLVNKEGFEGKKNYNF